MGKGKHTTEDERNIVIEGKFSLDKLLSADSTTKKRKLRLKVRWQRFWYGILDKRDECRYRHQRAKRGYSDYDVMNIQMWFVRTLRPMLEKIIAHLYSYPEEITFEEWKAILEEMVVLLKVMDWDDEIFVREYMGISTEDFHIDTCNRVESQRELAQIRFLALFARWFGELSY